MCSWFTDQNIIKVIIGWKQQPCDLKDRRPLALIGTKTGNCQCLPENTMPPTTHLFHWLAVLQFQATKVELWLEAAKGNVFKKFRKAPGSGGQTEKPCLEKPGKGNSAVSVGSPLPCAGLWWQRLEEGDTEIPLASLTKGRHLNLPPTRSRHTEGEAFLLRDTEQRRVHIGRCPEKMATAHPPSHGHPP